MKLTIKLYATLSQYLPDGTSEHTTTINVDETATPFGIIDQFKVPRESAHLVLLNGVYIKPSDRTEPVLKDGDTLAIWPPVAGG